MEEQRASKEEQIALRNVRKLERILETTKHIITASEACTDLINYARSLEQYDPMLPTYSPPQEPKDDFISSLPGKFTSLWKKSAKNTRVIEQTEYILTQEIARSIVSHADITSLAALLHTCNVFHKAVNTFLQLNLDKKQLVLLHMRYKLSPPQLYDAWRTMKSYSSAKNKKSKGISKQLKLERTKIDKNLRVGCFLYRQKSPYEQIAMASVINLCTNPTEQQIEEVRILTYLEKVNGSIPQVAERIYPLPSLLDGQLSMHVICGSNCVGKNILLLEELHLVVHIAPLDYIHPPEATAFERTQNILEVTSRYVLYNIRARNDRLNLVIFVGCKEFEANLMRIPLPLPFTVDSSEPHYVQQAKEFIIEHLYNKHLRKNGKNEDKNWTFLFDDDWPKIHQTIIDLVSQAALNDPREFPKIPKSKKEVRVW